MHWGDIGASFTFRLTLASTLLFSLAAAFLIALSFWMTVQRPLDRLRYEIDKEALALAAIYNAPGDKVRLVDALKQRAGQLSSRAPFHMLLDRDGRVVESNLPFALNQIPDRRWLRIEFELNEGPAAGENEAVLRAIEFVDGTRLLIGRDSEDLDEREELITEVLGWAAVLTALFGVAGGLLLSYGVSRQIESITSSARRILAGDLSERVAVRGTDDDFDRLAVTLNAMLDRIHELIGSIARVSDNIAHELRTPLTRLIASLEVMEDSDQRLQGIDDVRAEAVRLKEIFDSLLRIARIEAGSGALVLEEADVASILQEAAETYAPAAQSREILLHVAASSSPCLRADRHLLFQALTNLLDNAVKFCATGGKIELRCRTEGRSAVLSVSDTGAGVEAAHRPRLGERFYRIDPSGNGHGLGLALVRSIARAHKGTLIFPETTSGFSAELHLPLQVAVN